MPQIAIITNQPTPENSAAFRKQLSERLAEWLHKPEAYCMVHTQFETGLSFAGNEDPAATVEVASLGMTDDQPAQLTPQIGDWIRANLGIPLDRIYICFAAPPRTHWGWNGKTFG